MIKLAVLLLTLCSIGYCADVNVFGHHWEALGKVRVHKHSVVFEVSKKDDDSYLTSTDLMGYGTYTMTFKVLPNKSGSVAAGYSFLMGSETEIDVEEQGSKPGEVEFTNWVNPLMGTMHRSLFEKPKQFHVFTYVWIPGKITYFVDGEEVGESITNVPNLPANFVFEFYAMNDETWGGTWKRGKRHMTVVDFHYSPKYYWRQP